MVLPTEADLGGETGETRDATSEVVRGAIQHDQELVHAALIELAHKVVGHDLEVLGELSRIYLTGAVVVSNEHEFNLNVRLFSHRDAVAFNIVGVRLE